MLPGKEILFIFIGSFLLQLTTASNTKHMYALCPPDFFGIGTECYYISQKKENWLDAHFDCKDRKSRLAEPNRYEDRMIRKFLINNDVSKERKWIGGNYNWAQKKWQWQDGKEFVYQSFSQMPGRVQELQYHCAILNPSLKYRWSASSCVEKHNYICQHRMPYVNDKHRSRIYARWNQTYPNEHANQVEVVLNDTDMLKRGHRQSIPVNGRSTNTQRLNRHRNYLASQWLKKYRSQQIIINRNTIPNEITLFDPRERKVPQRPNRLPPRRRNPSIGRDDFIQFEKKKKVYRGPLLTNKVDDFEKQELHTQAPSVSSYDEQTRRQSTVDITTPPPPRSYKVSEEVDLKEKKRLEDTKRLLETGRYENSYTRRRIATTTTTPTPTTEPNVNEVDNERIELERNRELERRQQQQEEEAEQRRRDEEIRRNEISRRDELRRREEERQKMEEQRMKEQQVQEEKRIEEERLQNQINEETLRIEHENELRRLRTEEEEQRRAEEKRRIHEEHLRDREEKMRMRELELKEREDEERRLREDEEKRQEENRKLLEEIERQQREQEEKKRQAAENKRIEEENRRRKKEELRNKQLMKQNQLDDSYEDEILRVKEKNRRDKIAKLKERIKNLSPEDQLKFFELRGQRIKKHSNDKDNETTTNQL